MEQLAPIFKRVVARIAQIVVGAENSVAVDVVVVVVVGW